MVNPDFRDLFAALNEAQARHFVASPANAPRVFRALRDFGAPMSGVPESDFLAPGAVLQIGVAPKRIDVTTHVDGGATSRSGSSAGRT